MGDVPCGEEQGRFWDGPERLLKLGESAAVGEFFKISSAEFAPS